MRDKSDVVMRKEIIRSWRVGEWGDYIERAGFQLVYEALTETALPDALACRGNSGKNHPKTLIEHRISMFVLKNAAKPLPVGFNAMGDCA